jgi:hypothetical protein
VFSDQPGNDTSGLIAAPSVCDGVRDFNGNKTGAGWQYWQRTWLNAGQNRTVSGIPNLL